MARGFGITVGSGTGTNVTNTDRVATTYGGNADFRTHAFWAASYPDGTFTGRILAKSDVSGEYERVGLDAFNLRVGFGRAWTGGLAEWFFPWSRLRSWDHYAITYDSRLAANNPIMYWNGVAQPITLGLVASGTRVDNAAVFEVGNRFTNDRSSHALVAEYGLWNDILTATEILQLARGEKLPSEIRRPQLYLPLLGEANEPDYSGYGSAQVVTGAKVWEHPPRIRHAWSQPRIWNRLPLADTLWQFARPGADVSAGSWTPSAGGSLFDTLDETVSSDTDYARSGVTPVNDTAKLDLTDLSTPKSGDVILRVRYRLTP